MSTTLQEVRSQQWTWRLVTCACAVVICFIAFKISECAIDRRERVQKCIDSGEVPWICKEVMPP